MLDRSTPVPRLLPLELSLLAADSTIFFASPSCKVQTVVSQTVIQFTCSFNIPFITPFRKSFSFPQQESSPVWPQEPYRPRHSNTRSPVWGWEGYPWPGGYPWTGLWTGPVTRIGGTPQLTDRYLWKQPTVVLRKRAVIINDLIKHKLLYISIYPNLP